MGRVERGIPGNPRGPKLLPVPEISVWPSIGTVGANASV